MNNVYCIVVRGPLGSGKTTIARKLAHHISAQYFSVDEVIDQFGLGDDIEDGYISQKSFIGANEILIPKIIQLLEQGRSSVVDGNFYWKSQVEHLQDAIGSNLIIITLEASFETCVERDTGRDKSLGEGAVRVVGEKVREFEVGYHINAEGGIDETMDNIMKILNSYLK